MSRVLVVSGDRVGPRMAGTGIRAFEIASALAGHGLDVVLAAPDSVDLDPPFGTLGYGPSGSELRPAIDDADAVLLGGMVLARHPWITATSVPLVVDVYGPYVLENLPASAEGGSTAQRRRRRHASDVAALALELRRGDFFMCASEKQRDFWLGALAACGRLNPDTYADDETFRRLIDVVPFGVPAEMPVRRARPIRAMTPGIGASDRVVLWSGGLWDWMDPLTPIRAVAELSRTRNDVKLYYMGARTPSPDVPPMQALGQSKALARTLGVLDRQVFFADGWVPYEQRADYLLEADVAVSLHHPHVETRFAFRTRLLDCIWAGLPMLVTSGDVLSEVIVERGVGRAVAPGDVGAVVSGLVQLLDGPRNDAARAAAFGELRDAYAWPRVVAPLLRFLQAPSLAADRPALGSETVGTLAATPVAQLPGRALEALREGGLLLLAEEASRYLRWRRR